MQFLRKHLHKIAFAIAGLLLIISIVASAVSLASYITGRTAKNDNVNVAPISCSFTVDKSGLGTFINAAFMQSIVPGQTEPVQMNTFSESEITVKNSGNYGNNYRFSFIFYIPEDFATKMMFQLVKLDNSRATVTASSASKLYQINDNYSVSEASLADVKEIPNEYQDLIDGGNELVLTSYATRDATQREVVRKITYTTYYNEEVDFSEEGGAQELVQVTRLMCPVTVESKEKINYCRLTVSLPMDEAEFILKENTSQTFLFRCVPRETLSSTVYDREFDAAALKGAGTVPSVPDGYNCRWKAGVSEPVLEITDESGKWRQINAITKTDCIGITNPTKVNVVFTQVS